MHVPDGFINAPISIAAGVVAAGALAVCLRGARKELDDKTAPLAGLVAAFVFAVQMLNFPVVGGTSGHLLGATLAAVLLGPWLACLVMSVVLTVQAFAFADGGITALGANVLNMGVIGALFAGIVLGWAIRTSSPNRTVFLSMVGLTSWVAVMLGATATSFQLALSDTVPLDTVLPAMLGVHALIGIGEAIITVAAVGAVLATRPDLIGLGKFGPEPGTVGQPPSQPATGGATA